MRKSRFIEEQIVAILAERERGVPTADDCRKHGLSTATFYKCKAKYGGLDIIDARKLKLLEIENGRLKRMGRFLCASDALPSDLQRAGPALIQACASATLKTCDMIETAAASAVQGERCAPSVIRRSRQR